MQRLRTELDESRQAGEDRGVDVLGLELIEAVESPTAGSGNTGYDPYNNPGTVHRDKDADGR